MDILRDVIKRAESVKGSYKTHATKGSRHGFIAPSPDASGTQGGHIVG